MARVRTALVGALLTIACACAASSASAAVLVDQYSDPASGVDSQDFNNNGSFDGFEQQLADDFVVPAAERWSITGVDASGEYARDATSTLGPVQSVDVYIYPGSSISGTTPIARKAQAWTDISSGQGSLRISFDSPVELTQGTYWVSVWAHLPAAANGFWLWRTRTFITGAQAVAYFSNTFVFCTPLGWHLLKSCHPAAQFGPDLVWRLNGVKRDRLAYQKLGAGTGKVTSSPAGIDCPEGCLVKDALFDDGTQVELTATAAINDVFTGWTGCDNPAGTKCTMNMNTPAARKDVSATFVPGARLDFRKTGAGDALVTSSVGADCPIGDCKTKSISWKFVKGGQATITANTASTDSYLAGWTGCDHPNGRTCVMDMTGAKTLRADFELAAAVTIDKEGDGDGTIVSDPEGIACGIGECRHKLFQKFPAHSSVTFTAQPSLDSPTSVFAGWTGCHHPSGRTCVMDLGDYTDDPLLVANFNPGRLATVSKTGTGSGTVTSLPAANAIGIDCGALCASAFEPNAAVTLKAQPDPGSIFAGWSGACSGVGDCVLVMNEDRVVAASFNLDGITPPPPTKPPATTIPNSSPEPSPPKDPGRIAITRAEIEAKKQAVQVPFECAAHVQCSLTMQIVASKHVLGLRAAASKTVVLGNGKGKVKPGKTGKVKVKLTRSAVKQLKKKKKIKVTIKTVVKTGDTKATIEKKVTLKG